MIWKKLKMQTTVVVFPVLFQKYLIAFGLSVYGSRRYYGLQQSKIQQDSPSMHMISLVSFFIFAQNTIKRKKMTWLLSNVSRFFLILLNPFSGDILVSKEKFDNGHIVWGSTIIGLVFLPNTLFMLWMILGSRRKLCHRDTGIRLAAGTGIQCITICR